MIRVTVDFNSILPEPDDRVPIGVEGQPEIKPHLQEGLRVLLCTSDLEVEGNLQFDDELNSWLAKPDWSTQRDV